MIIYDCEIFAGIESKPEKRFDDIQYCNGWRDFEGMGLTVVGVYDYWEDRYRVFMEDNFHDFMAMLISQNAPFVGFNSIPFDNQLLRANGFVLDDVNCYDILREVWVAAGLGPEFKISTHTGYGLGDLCQTNFGIIKSGHGAMAPVDWQRGRFGAVTDYCLHDVRMTKLLLDQILKTGQLEDPKNGNTLTVRRPS